MIALRTYPGRELWSAPGLTWDEAWATVVAWREWGFECIVVDVPDDAIDFEDDDDDLDH